LTLFKSINSARVGRLKLMGPCSLHMLNSPLLRHWKCRISGSASTETLGSILKKCTVDYVVDPPHMQVLVSIGSKGPRLRMREIVTVRRLFFLFFYRFHAHRYIPVGPIVAVNGSNDASSWPSCPFYGFVNKKYFSLFFTQKYEKMHYTLWEL